MRIHRLTRFVTLGAVAAILAWGCASRLGNAAEEKKKADGWQEKFSEDKSDLVSTGKNPFFILEPGYVLTLESSGEKAKGQLIVTVLPETKMIDGVETRVVEERESKDGKLVEVSRNFFAISKKTNNVYYFGEETTEYKNGKPVKGSDSWESGKKGAAYGMIMPAKPAVGMKFYQEHAPKAAMDRCEILSVTDTVEVPAGKFENCLKTEETTPLEPKEKEYKLYAPGVGLLQDEDMKLVRHGMEKK